MGNDHLQLSLLPLFLPSSVLTKGYITVVTDCQRVVVWLNIIQHMEVRDHQRENYHRAMRNHAGQYNRIFQYSMSIS